MDEEFDDSLVSLPRRQVQRVTALVISDVRQSLVPQKHFHHLTEKDTLTFNANIFIQTKSTIILGVKGHRDSPVSI